MVVDVARRTDGRQLFCQINKKRGHVHGAIRHTKGGVVSCGVGPHRSRAS
jgi:hypothetical protein